MILVTGGSGYLGRALVGALRAQGADVRVLARNPAGPGEVRGDLLDPRSLVLATSDADLVFHLAARVDHAASFEELAPVNVEGTLALARACAESGVRRLVHCSSVSAEPGGGSTPYGRTKIEAERGLQTLAQEGLLGALEVVVVRPGPVYDHERANIARIVRFARFTRICPRPVPDRVVHLASRGNVVTGMWIAAREGRAGGSYVLCDAEPVTRSELSRAIAREVGAVTVPLPTILAWPFLAAYLAAKGAALRAVGRRSSRDLRYLRVLTRERRYDTSRTLSELSFQPASTAAEFGAAVRACLSDKVRTA